MDGSSALGMFLLIFRHIISRWLMGISNKLLCNDSYCKLRKKSGGMVRRVLVDSRKEGHSPAAHHRSASWDTCTAPLSLTCHCKSVEDRQVLCSPPRHFPSEPLSVSRGLQAEHTQPREHVTRIVKEADRGAHLRPPAAEADIASRCPQLMCNVTWL